MIKHFNQVSKSFREILFPSKVLFASFQLLQKKHNFYFIWCTVKPVLTTTCHDDHRKSPPAPINKIFRLFRAPCEQQPPKQLFGGPKDGHCTQV